tara:strand:+ start:855 stop:1844 length:990 start_codon:yes stop_codon:yes gene_type:complete
MGWDTYVFLANNIDVIYGQGKIKKSPKSRIPHSVVFTHDKIKYKVFDRSMICNNALYDLYFKFSKDGVFERTNEHVFDWDLYYAFYHESIHIKYNGTDMSTQEKTVLYFIKFGYWFGMKIPDIDNDILKNYRASYDDLRHLTILECKHHLLYHKRPVMFSKWAFLASHYEYLRHMNHDDIPDYYVTQSIYTQNLSFEFDHMIFLSKYPGSISVILEKEYDMSLLTKDAVAKFYIQNIKNLQTYRGSLDFDSYTFVKEFLKDKRVNSDGTLSLNNAHKFFVRGFVEHKDIREHVKRTYAIKRFARRRIKDALRQIPFGIIRYVIEFKLYM